MGDPRLAISLRTGSGERDYYDQIMGMSQGIINSSFGKLYEKYEALRTCNVTIRDGSITGELNPPKVTIPAHENSFKSGTMRTNNGWTLDLAKWIIIIECDMDLKGINRSPGSDESAADRAQREQFEDTFLVPGDYRVERLYVKLTSANWNKVDDASRVVNPRTKEECSFAEWEADVDKWNDQGEGDYDDSVDDFLGMMRRWTRELERDSLTTLGFKLTKPKIDDNPTFVPTSLVHSSYPYVNPQGNVGGDPLTGGIYNCFLYLETVGERPGPPRLLEWSANLAFPAGGGFSETSGSFVLSRQLFMEQFLLPQLQELNRNTTIYIEPTRSAEGWAFPNSFDQGLNDPAGPNDPKFAYEVLADETAARYHNALDKPRAPHQVTPGDAWRRFEHKSETTITVRWIPGANKFEIKGDIHYVRQAYISWSSSSPDRNNSGNWSEEDYKWPWSFDVSIAQQDGSLIITFPEDVQSGQSVVTLDGSHPWIDDAVDLKNNGLDKHIRPRIENTINSLNRRLNDNFKNAGKFVYPGSGQLEFSSPGFARNGCLYCDVEWKP
ncbi:hypothetical protein EV127DRAFT_484805 [Xylaria flabelliformis]|nr:hypothetical protein EV127DRAFT_484805 [Xylaria flabelliformis]